MLRVWHGLKTVLNTFVEISLHKMQPIPTNCHFCHRYESFLSCHFGHSELFRGYPAINVGLAVGELF